MSRRSVRKRRHRAMAGRSATITVVDDALAFDPYRDPTNGRPGMYLEIHDEVHPMRGETWDRITRCAR